MSPKLDFCNDFIKKTSYWNTPTRGIGATRQMEPGGGSQRHEIATAAERRSGDRLVSL